MTINTEKLKELALLTKARQGVARMPPDILLALIESHEALLAALKAIKRGDDNPCYIADKAITKAEAL